MEQGSLYDAPGVMLRRYPADGLIPGSSVVEQAAVNRSVVGSSPTLGAISPSLLLEFFHPSVFRQHFNQHHLRDVCERWRAIALVGLLTIHLGSQATHRATRHGGRVFSAPPAYLACVLSFCLFY